MQGDALSASERSRIAKEIVSLTGLTEEYVLKQNLRVSIFGFVTELRKDENRNIGRLDSRITGIADNNDGGGARSGGGFFDPSMEAILGGYTTAMNDYARRELKYENDLAYEILTGRVQPWSYANVENEYLNVAETLKRAMTKNPFLKVWVSNGYYDLATPYFATDYTVRHMGLDPAVRGNITMTYYEAGHMMYIHLDSLKKFKADYTAYMAATLKSAGVK